MIKAQRTLILEIPIAGKSVQFNKRLLKTGKGVRFFNDKKKDDYYDSVIALCANCAPPKPFLGPIKLSVIFYLPRPGRLMRKKDPDVVVLNPKRS